MPKTKSLPFALLLSTLALTTLAAEAPAPEAEIMALEKQWSDDFGAGNIDAIMALMATQSVLIMPGSDPIVRVGEIREATAAMLESSDAVSWKSDFAAVAPGGDMAYDYGTATTTLPDGSATTSHYLVVWVKENGEWKVAADMFN